jgi:hypothetical protein
MARTRPDDLRAGHAAGILAKLHLASISQHEALREGSLGVKNSRKPRAQWIRNEVTQLPGERQAQASSYLAVAHDDAYTTDAEEWSSRASDGVLVTT